MLDEKTLNLAKDYAISMLIDVQMLIAGKDDVEIAGIIDNKIEEIEKECELEV